MSKSIGTPSFPDSSSSIARVGRQPGARVCARCAHQDQGPAAPQRRHGPASRTTHRPLRQPGAEAGTARIDPGRRQDARGEGHIDFDPQRRPGRARPSDVHPTSCTAANFDAKIPPGGVGRSMPIDTAISPDPSPDHHPCCRTIRCSCASRSPSRRVPSRRSTPPAMPACRAETGHQDPGETVAVGRELGSPDPRRAITLQVHSRPPSALRRSRSVGSRCRRPIAMDRHPSSRTPVGRCGISWSSRPTTRGRPSRHRVVTGFVRLLSL